MYINLIGYKLKIAMVEPIFILHFWGVKFLGLSNHLLESLLLVLILLGFAH